MRRAFPLVLGMLAASGGCTCGKRGELVDASGAPLAPSGSAAAGAPASAELSAPIGAALAPGGVVWVAGLSVPRSAIVLERHEGAKVTASADIHAGVRFTPDIELRVQAAAPGVAVGLRGKVGDETVRRIALFDAAARPVGAPVTLGAAWCGTDDGVVVAEPQGASGTPVVLLPWAGGAKTASLLVAPDRDAVLACAPRRAFVLGQGEEDATLQTLPGERPALRVLGDLEDEREHQAFVFGDALGVVQVGASGSARIARTDGAGALGAWRRVARGVTPDDDLLAVDGDESVAVLVVGHDAGQRCPTEAGSDALAVRVGSKNEEKSEEQHPIVQGDCGHDLGPFWIGRVKDAWVVAWVERAPRKAPTDAPIVALGYRTVGEAGPHRVPLSADALVFAGCAADGCRAISLDRPAGTDGMRPGRARVLSFP